MNIGYNTASELLSITDPTQPTLAATYSYDPMSRLTSYLQGSIAQGYSYDADGNRTNKTLGAATSTYNYAAGSNRLASIQSNSGTTNFTQDANGATTDDVTRQYSYDARGRLIQATTVAGIINYEVNVLGLRVRKQVPYNSTDTIYHYDNQGHLIGESPTGSTGFTREYIYLGDQPVAVMQ
jgi:YD repeat-containing protein